MTINDNIELLCTKYNADDLQKNEDLIELLNKLNDDKVIYGGDKEYPDYHPILETIKKYL